MRLLFWVQHLLGSGHIHRAARIARALVAAGVETHVLTGGPPVPFLDWGGARTYQLPIARARDVAFSAIVDETGRPVDAVWKKRRAAETLSYAAAIRPDALLIELWPFGRRSFGFELRPLVGMAAAHCPRRPVFCSVRDVLVTKPIPSRIDAVVASIRDEFDHVLVHGDPDVIPLSASFPAADQLADQLIYTGYVTLPPVARTANCPDCTNEIVVSAGGGVAGMPLYQAAVAAANAGVGGGRLWRLLIGAGLPAADRDRLTAATGPGVVLEPARQDFPTLLATAALSVSQAGYNTTMDIISAGCRALVVPFAAGGESEQSIRAAYLAERGAFSVLNEDEIDGERLGRAVDRALAAPPPVALELRRDGAARTADIITALVTRR